MSEQHVYGDREREHIDSQAYQRLRKDLSRIFDLPGTPTDAQIKTGIREILDELTAATSSHAETVVKAVATTQRVLDNYDDFIVQTRAQLTRLAFVERARQGWLSFGSHLDEHIDTGLMEFTEPAPDGIPEWERCEKGFECELARDLINRTLADVRRSMDLLAREPSLDPRTALDPGHPESKKLREAAPLDKAVPVRPESEHPSVSDDPAR